MIDCELTLEMLEEAINQLPLITYPKQVRISYNDYVKMRHSCDILKMSPEQPQGYTLGCLGERIIPDISILDNHFEVDW